MKKSLPKLLLVACALLVAALFFPPACRAGNAVMGGVNFEGSSHADKTSGVWIDGEYVGYLKELKGDKQIMLLPGQHTIVIRQDGYLDYAKEITIRPGEDQFVSVAMVRDTRPLPQVTSTVKISANPTRAAVFMDGQFVGHVGEFNIGGRALLVPPGAHRIRIALPGYESFEADINPQPDQKVEIKTDLLKSKVPINDALLAPGENAPAQNEENVPGSMASPTEASPAETLPMEK